MKHDPRAHPPAAGTDHLLFELHGLIKEARTHVAQTANATLTMLYWHVGTASVPTC